MKNIRFEYMILVCSPTWTCNIQNVTFCATGALVPTVTPIHTRSIYMMTLLSGKAMPTWDTTIFSVHMICTIWKPVYIVRLYCCVKVNIVLYLNEGYRTKCVLCRISKYNYNYNLHNCCPASLDNNPGHMHHRHCYTLYKCWNIVRHNLVQRIHSCILQT